MISGHTAMDDTLLRHVSAESERDGARYIDAARAMLARLTSRPALDRDALQRKPGGYARTLLFGDARISVWAFVWDVGAATAIHDHHCSCCFGILSGTLQEVRYSATDTARAVVSGHATRSAGHIACMLPSRPNLHQIRNESGDEAISLHIYGFDHRRHASSVGREYQATVN